MTRNLSADLQALAHSGPGADDAHLGATIADRAGYMVRQVRRKRAARQVGIAAVGATAVAAVALAGTRLPTWIQNSQVAAGETGTPSATDPATDPTVEPTPGPTTDPTPGPTPGPTTDPTPVTGSGPELPTGLALIESTFDVDLSCGAVFTDTTVATSASFLWGDHLSPHFETVPMRADESLTLVNAFPALSIDYTSPMRPAVLITRDGLIVGYGAGELNPDAVATPVQMDYSITLDALHTCTVPAPAPDGLGTYTVWIMNMETGTTDATGTDTKIVVSTALTIKLGTGQRPAADDELMNSITNAANTTDDGAASNDN